MVRISFSSTNSFDKVAWPMVLRRRRRRRGGEGEKEGEREKGRGRRRKQERERKKIEKKQISQHKLPFTY